MDKNSIAYRMELALLMVVLLFWVTVCADDSKIISDRYAVYWNSTNPRYETPNKPTYKTLRVYKQYYFKPTLQGKHWEFLDRCFQTTGNFFFLEFIILATNVYRLHIVKMQNFYLN